MMKNRMKCFCAVLGSERSNSFTNTFLFWAININFTANPIG